MQMPGPSPQAAAADGWELLECLLLESPQEEVGDQFSEPDAAGGGAVAAGDGLQEPDEAGASMQAQPPLAAPPAPDGDGRHRVPNPLPAGAPRALHIACGHDRTPPPAARPASGTHGTPAEQSRAEQSRGEQSRAGAVPTAAAAPALVPTAAAPAAALAAAAGAPETAAAAAAAGPQPAAPVAQQLRVALEQLADRERAQGLQFKTPYWWRQALPEWDAWWCGHRSCRVAPAGPYPRVAPPRLSAPGTIWPRLNLHPPELSAAELYAQETAEWAERGWSWQSYWRWDADSSRLVDEGGMVVERRRRGGDAVREGAGDAAATAAAGADLEKALLALAEADGTRDAVPWFENFLRTSMIPQALQVQLRQLWKEVRERGNAPTGESENDHGTEAKEQDGSCRHPEPPAAGLRVALAAAAERAAAEGLSAGSSSGSPAGPVACLGGSGAATAPASCRADDSPDVTGKSARPSARSVHVRAAAAADTGSSGASKRALAAAAACAGAEAVTPQQPAGRITIEPGDVMSSELVMRPEEAMIEAGLNPRARNLCGGAVVDWTWKTVAPSPALHDYDETAKDIRCGTTRVRDPLGWSHDGSLMNWAQADDPDLLDPLTTDTDFLERLEQRAFVLHVRAQIPALNAAPRGEPLCGRGRVIIEACGPRGCPPTAELQSRVFVHDMRLDWECPDPATDRVVGQGHTGQSGLILRNIAFNRYWGGVVAAARRACNCAWWNQLRGGARVHGLEPLRLTIICGNGRHRSVGAAYLLAAGLVEMEGAAGAEVHLLECPPCACPSPWCNRHAGWPGQARIDAAFGRGRALCWTYALLEADQCLMPRAELRL